MSTFIRQPFAPLNEARLQALTSLKNRQNAILNSSPSKRKASDLTDDLENVNPLPFSKRAKGGDGLFQDSSIMPSTLFTTEPASVPNFVVKHAPVAPLRKRALLNARSSGAKLNAVNTVNAINTVKTCITRPSAFPTSAGRPLGRNRAGLLSRKRTVGSFMRVESPVVGHPASSSPASFSLDAALQGTFSSYTSRDNVPSKQLSSSVSDFNGLHEPKADPSWFFEIHEDTEAEEATNMLQHCACTLDISSDEESEERQRRERAEGKENVPPMDDVSQTSFPRAARPVSSQDVMMFEKERNPLSEMDPTQYYSSGCDENSVIIVLGDEDEETAAQDGFQFASQVNLPAPIPTLPAEEEEEEEEPLSVEELMRKTDKSVLESDEDTDESFEVWESSSAKDEAERAEAGKAEESC